MSKEVNYPETQKVLKYERMSKTLLSLLVMKYKSALEDIVSTQGKVCGNYEICNHVSCSSSYASWAIADKALHEIKE